MNIKYISGCFLVVLGLLVADTSYAYKITDQKAVRLNDEIVMFTVTYDFGFLNADVWMPVGAIRSTAYPNSGKYLGYKFVEESGEERTVGDSHAVILSEAKVTNGYYYVPKGDRATFTLLTLLEKPKVIDSLQSPTVLQVTSLPHVIVKDGEKSGRNLTLEQLKSYKTPQLDISN